MTLNPFNLILIQTTTQTEQSYQAATQIFTQQPVMVRYKLDYSFILPIQQFAVPVKTNSVALQQVLILPKSVLTQVNI